MGTRFSRRTVTAFLGGMMCGCAMSPAESPDASLSRGRAIVVQPKYHPEPQLEVANTTRGSATDRFEDQVRITNALRGWNRQVVPSFTNALVAALNARSIEVAHWSQPDVSQVEVRRTPGWSVVDCSLTVGFVCPTWTSPSFVPVVGATLVVWADTGLLMFRKYRPVTNRPFNLFMDTLPAESSYEVADLGVLELDPVPAIDALEALARQLGRDFGSKIPA